MRLFLDSTTKLINVNGIEARVWQGYTPTRVPVWAVIVHIAAAIEQDTAQLEEELSKHADPRPDVEVLAEQVTFAAPTLTDRVDELEPEPVREYPNRHPRTES